MDADENIMTHPDTSLREGVSFALLFDLRGSCGSLVSEFHELWPWIESKSGRQLFCVMEYNGIYIYIRIYDDYVCNDGTNIEFHNIILYYNCYSTISSTGGLGGSILMSAIGLAKSEPNFIVFFFIFV